jgi:hypothetical protein
MSDAQSIFHHDNGHYHISEDNLVLFALQFLPDDQAATVVAHLRQCEPCRMALGEIQGNLAAYALTSEVHEVPAHSREQFLRRVANEKKLVSIASAKTEAARSETPGRQIESRPEPVLAARGSRIDGSQIDGSRIDGSRIDDGRAADRDSRVAHIDEGAPRRRRAVTMAWIGWAVAAALGVFAFLQFQQRQLMQSDLLSETAGLTQATQRAAQQQDQAEAAQEALQTLTTAGAMQVSLHLPAVKSPQPEAHAAYIASKGALVLVASHLHPLAAGKTYQLWLLPATPGEQPLSAGTFKPDAKGYASVVLPTLPKGVQAKGFGVTVEPDGGSPAPTPPIVLAGF